ncbi:UPF0182 family membrane protein [Parafrigoribacterium humi]|uniref:UPF0182 family membrane protein n=1 Tax=Parafrigoribacterium humi TaxID=3144664 RepID=UPI0032F02182
MTSTATDERQPRSRSRATVLISIAIIAVLVIAFFIFASLYTDWLWFSQLGYRGVLTTQWIAGSVMFLIGFFGMAIPVWASIEVAFRWRPVYAKLNSQLDRYQQVIEPLRRLAMYGIPVILGLFAGAASSSRWQLALQWLNATPVGKTDPQFHLDISFYLFDLPFFRSVAAFASAVVLLSAIATLATSYLYGAIRLNGRELRISRSARIQLATIGAVYLALQAVSIWLDQYATLASQTSTDLITGASYTDVFAVIPGRAILAGIAAVVAVLFVITAFIGRWRLPIVGTALLLVSGLLIGAVYPWIVERFQVEPSARSLEKPYIERNIAATRDAYGVAGVQEEPYTATSDAEPGALRNDAETTANIRILDPALVSDTFAQLEQIKQYYRFPSSLDVDRYTIDGKTQDTVIAVRELDQKQLGDANSWYNNTVVYTHGYGVVAAYGNQRSSEGFPVFLESGIPVKGKLGKFEPRIYFGENSPGYSIVGAPKGAPKIEFDYPAGDKQSNKNATTTYDGNGGPKLDNVFTKLVYAIKFQSEQILLSEAVNKDSQILYTRDPKARVAKVAPYLTLDSDAYPAVIDGRVKWIVDGYTTSAQYPYSKTEQLSSAIADTYQPAPDYPIDTINYIRNSVKATVDAYSGKVTLYAWDAKDPILKTWEKIFPSTVKPMSDMSSQLLSHVRYPADLFKVQRAILGTYHVTDSDTFYSSSDAWVSPPDPTKAKPAPLQPPYYLTMKMPGAKKPAFSIYSTYIPKSSTDDRSILTGYLAANADAGDTKGTISPDYGKLTLLTLPKQDTVPGPGQVQNNFNTDTAVANQISLLQKGDTQVKRGNLLTVPVGGGLLYVQPLYVESTAETTYPILRKVLVSFGDKIAFEDTLDAALDDLFGGDSGAQAGDSGSESTPSTETPSPETPATPGPTTPQESAAVKAALADVQTALTDRDAALKSGDLTKYAAADEKLVTALKALFALEG